MQLRGIQTELVEGGTLLVANNATIIFDTILNDQSLNLNYDSITGEFIVSEIGNYYVAWWIDTLNSELDPIATFSIAIDGVPYSRGSSPIITGQVSGSAFVTIGAVPATISLVNVSGYIVRLADTPIQANIVILELSV